MLTGNSSPSHGGWPRELEASGPEQTAGVGASSRPSALSVAPRLPVAVVQRVATRQNSGARLHPSLSKRLDTVSEARRESSARGSLSHDELADLAQSLSAGRSAGEDDQKLGAHETASSRARGAAWHGAGMAPAAVRPVAVGPRRGTARRLAPPGRAVAAQAEFDSTAGAHELSMGDNLSQDSWTGRDRVDATRQRRGSVTSVPSRRGSVSSMQRMRSRSVVIQRAFPADHSSASEGGAPVRATGTSHAAECCCLRLRSKALDASFSNYISRSLRRLGWQPLLAIGGIVTAVEFASALVGFTWPDVPDLEQRIQRGAVLPGRWTDTIAVGVVYCCLSLAFFALPACLPPRSSPSRAACSSWAGVSSGLATFAVFFGGVYMTTRQCARAFELPTMMTFQAWLGPGVAVATGTALCLQLRVRHFSIVNAANALASAAVATISARVVQDGAWWPPEPRDLLWAATSLCLMAGASWMLLWLRGFVTLQLFLTNRLLRRENRRVRLRLERPLGAAVSCVQRALALEASVDFRWLVFPDELHVGQVLGRGADSVVYAGSLYGWPVVIKRHRGFLRTEEDFKRFAKGMDLVTQLQSPHVVRILGASFVAKPTAQEMSGASRRLAFQHYLGAMNSSASVMQSNGGSSRDAASMISLHDDASGRRTATGHISGSNRRGLPGMEAPNGPTGLSADAEFAASPTLGGSARGGPRRRRASLPGSHHAGARKSKSGFPGLMPSSVLDAFRLAAPRMRASTVSGELIGRPIVVIMDWMSLGSLDTILEASALPLSTEAPSQTGAHSHRGSTNSAASPNPVSQRALATSRSAQSAADQPGGASRAHERGDASGSALSSALPSRRQGKPRSGSVPSAREADFTAIGSPPPRPGSSVSSHRGRGSVASSMGKAVGLDTGSSSREESGSASSGHPSGGCPVGHAQGTGKRAHRGALATGTAAAAAASAIASAAVASRHQRGRSSGRDGASRGTSGEVLELHTSGMTASEADGPHTGEPGPSAAQATLSNAPHVVHAPALHEPSPGRQPTRSVLRRGARSSRRPPAADDAVRAGRRRDSARASSNLGSRPSERAGSIVSLAGPSDATPLGEDASVRLFRMPWGVRLRILRHIAMGCKHLHSFEPPVVHGDLRPDNIQLHGSPLRPLACVGDLTIRGFTYEPEWQKIVQQAKDAESHDARSIISSISRRIFRSGGASGLAVPAAGTPPAHRAGRSPGHKPRTESVERPATATSRLGKPRGPPSRADQRQQASSRGGRYPASQAPGCSQFALDAGADATAAPSAVPDSAGLASSAQSRLTRSGASDRTLRSRGPVVSPLPRDPRRPPPQWGRDARVTPFSSGDEHLQRAGPAIPGQQFAQPALRPSGSFTLAASDSDPRSRSATPVTKTGRPLRTTASHRLVHPSGAPKSPPRETRMLQASGAAGARAARAKPSSIADFRRAGRPRINVRAQPATPAKAVPLTPQPTSVPFLSPAASSAALGTSKMGTSTAMDLSNAFDRVSEMPATFFGMMHSRIGRSRGDLHELAAVSAADSFVEGARLASRATGDTGAGVFVAASAGATLAQAARFGNTAAQRRASELVELERLTYFTVPAYTAPELFEPGAVPSPAGDVFAFAMVAFEVVTGRRPFRNELDDRVAVMLALEDRRPPLGLARSDVLAARVRQPDGSSSALTQAEAGVIELRERLESIIRACWETDPSARPTFSRVVTLLESATAWYEQSVLQEQEQLEASLSSNGPVAWLDPTKLAAQTDLTGLVGQMWPQAGRPQSGAGGKQSAVPLVAGGGYSRRSPGIHGAESLPDQETQGQGGGSGLFSGLLLPSSHLAMEHVRLEKEIGHGAFGHVYRGTFHGTTVAIKTFDFTKRVSMMTKVFRREAAMLSAVRHPCVLSFVGVVVDARLTAIVTEYCANGSMQALVIASRRLSERARKKWGSFGRKPSARGQQRSLGPGAGEQQRILDKHQRDRVGTGQLAPHGPPGAAVTPIAGPTGAMSAGSDQEQLGTAARRQGERREPADADTAHGSPSAGRTPLPSESAPQVQLLTQRGIDAHAGSASRQATPGGISRRAIGVAHWSALKAAPVSPLVPGSRTLGQGDAAAAQARVPTQHFHGLPKAEAAASSGVGAATGSLRSPASPSGAVASLATWPVPSRPCGAGLPVASLRRRIHWLLSVCRGLQYLHGIIPSAKIVHRDIKSDNVLLSSSYEAKIADLGFAREAHPVMSRCGTLAFTAPEILSGQRYDERVDLYSLGVVISEVVTGRKPYWDWQMAEVAKPYRAGQPRGTTNSSDTGGKQRLRVTHQLMKSIVKGKARPSFAFERGLEDNVRGEFDVGLSPDGRLPLPGEPLKVSAGSVPPSTGVVPPLWRLQALAGIARACWASEADHRPAASLVASALDQLMRRSPDGTVPGVLAHQWVVSRLQLVSTAALALQDAALAAGHVCLSVPPSRSAAPSGTELVSAVSPSALLKRAPQSDAQASSGGQPRESNDGSLLRGADLHSSAGSARESIQSPASGWASGSSKHVGQPLSPDTKVASPRAGARRLAEPRRSLQSQGRSRTSPAWALRRALAQDSQAAGVGVRAPPASSPRTDEQETGRLAERPLRSPSAGPGGGNLGLGGTQSGADHWGTIAPRRALSELSVIRGLLHGALRIASPRPGSDDSEPSAEAGSNSEPTQAEGHALRGHAHSAHSVAGASAAGRVASDPPGSTPQPIAGRQAAHCGLAGSHDSALAGPGEVEAPEVALRRFGLAAVGFRGSPQDGASRLLRSSRAPLLRGHAADQGTSDHGPDQARPLKPVVARACELDGNPGSEDRRPQQSQDGRALASHPVRGCDSQTAPPAARCASQFRSPRAGGRREGELPGRCHPLHSELGAAAAATRPRTTSPGAEEDSLPFGPKTVADLLGAPGQRLSAAGRRLDLAGLRLRECKLDPSPSMLFPGEWLGYVQLTSSLLSSFLSQVASNIAHGTATGAVIGTEGLVGPPRRFAAATQRFYVALRGVTLSEAKLQFEQWASGRAGRRMSSLLFVRATAMCAPAGSDMARFDTPGVAVAAPGVDPLSGVAERISPADGGKGSHGKLAAASSQRDLSPPSPRGCVPPKQDVMLVSADAMVCPRAVAAWVVGAAQVCHWHASAPMLSFLYLSTIVKESKLRVFPSPVNWRRMCLAALALAQWCIDRKPLQAALHRRYARRVQLGLALGAGIDDEDLAARRSPPAGGGAPRSAGQPHGSLRAHTPARPAVDRHSRHALAGGSAGSDAGAAAASVPEASSRAGPSQRGPSVQVSRHSSAHPQPAQSSTGNPHWSSKQLAARGSHSSDVSEDLPALAEMPESGSDDDVESLQAFAREVRRSGRGKAERSGKSAPTARLAMEPKDGSGGGSLSRRRSGTSGGRADMHVADPMAGAVAPAAALIGGTSGESPRRMSATEPAAAALERSSELASQASFVAQKQALHPKRSAANPEASLLMTLVAALLPPLRSKLVVSMKALSNFRREFEHLRETNRLALLAAVSEASLPGLESPDQHGRDPGIDGGDSERRSVLTAEEERRVAISEFGAVQQKVILDGMTRAQQRLVAKQRRRRVRREASGEGQHSASGRAKFAVSRAGSSRSPSLGQSWEGSAFSLPSASNAWLPLMESSFADSQGLEAGTDV